jgi:hypothetical protein
MKNWENLEEEFYLVNTSTVEEIQRKSNLWLEVLSILTKMSFGTNISSKSRSLNVRKYLKNSTFFWIEIPALTNFEDLMQL